MRARGAGPDAGSERRTGVPSNANTICAEVERDRLIEAAAFCGPGDLIGHRAVAELLRRGYPDALWIPPEALEAYRDATSAVSRWRLWRIGVVVAVLFSASTGALSAVPFKAERPLKPAREPDPFICGLRLPSNEPAAPWAEHTRRIRVRWEDR